MEDPQKLVFIFCTLALLPLVKLHDLATKELAMRIGGSKTGLLNASMSNTVELVVATTALRKCQLRVVQSSLIGSMLSKMLLVLGMCFFAGGLRFSEQDFDPTATGIQSSLLSISVAAVLMPAAYHFSLSGGTGSASDEQKEDILRMSHGVALVLLSIHVAYLLFQFWSHTHLFKDNSKSSQPHDLHLMRFNSRATLVNTKSVEKAKVSPTYDLSRQPSSSSLSSIPYEANRPYNTVSPYSSSDVSLPMSNSSNSNPGSSSSTLGFVYSKATPAPALGSTVKIVHDGRHGHAGPATQLPTNTGPGYYPGRNVQFDEETIVDIPLGNERNEEPKEEPVQPQPKMKEPKLSWPMTTALLVVVAVLVSINAEWLVESMNGLSTDTISKEWIALILLPTVSCIAECVTAINVSVKDQLTLSISVAVGSTIQTALFVIPFMIILGWIMGKPLAMLFDPFESVVLYISVNVMGYVVADGKSNWLEGAILICLYIIIAVSFWFYPALSLSAQVILPHELLIPTHNQPIAHTTVSPYPDLFLIHTLDIYLAILLDP
ncbi:hypothetical protein EWM64_g720 [Hericium alpestre]|uniref:Sodium/calcium exchanger membrane region domain-containing protein n=1 Tax=Hericium alpestre TaxID=135208 RepID=A0A4Z0A9S5_9AGAM|nr:hypothetical protein EWM64_g720 [Hericium alpestre]